MEDVSYHLTSFLRGSPLCHRRRRRHCCCILLLRNITAFVLLPDLLYNCILDFWFCSYLAFVHIAFILAQMLSSRHAVAMGRAGVTWAPSAFVPEAKPTWEEHGGQDWWEPPQEGLSYISCVCHFWKTNCGFVFRLDLRLLKQILGTTGYPRFVCDEVCRGNEEKPACR